MKYLIATLLLFQSIAAWSWDCRKYDKVPGPEDIEVHLERAFALVSSSPRRNFSQNGQIFYLDLKVKNSKALPMLSLDELNKLGTFKPHGISIVEDRGRVFVFAINHPVDTGADIEKFEMRGKRLVHLKSFKSELFLNANDIVALNQNEFFLTPDHNAKNLWTRVFQDLIEVPSGRVRHYNEGKITTLDFRFRYSNGIAINQKRNRLYVSSTLGDSVDVFARQDFNWIHIQKFRLTGHADNLSWDSSGNLNVALQASKFKFALHAMDPNFRVASRIAKLPLDSEGRILLSKDIFQDSTGDAISGASVGAAFRDQLLVGAVFDEHFLRCFASRKE